MNVMSLKLLVSLTLLVTSSDIWMMLLGQIFDNVITKKNLSSTEISYEVTAVQKCTVAGNLKQLAFFVK